MRFIDAQARWFLGSLVLEDVFLVLWRVPKPSMVDGGDREVLGHSGNPCGDTFLPCVIIGDHERDLTRVSGFDEEPEGMFDEP